MKINTYEDILGSDAAQFIPVIENLLPDFINCKYHFMSEDDFKSLTYSDPVEGNSQYMKELLYRANFASLSAIARNFEWLRGMQTAYDADLYLPFASSFRCLIESVADSYFSLASLCTTLSKNIKNINDSVIKNTNDIIISTELENVLIHYSHARNIKKGETVPDNHRSETAASYVKNLDQQTNSNFYECYSELCQLSHPAAQGVLHMMISDSNNNFIFEHRFGKLKINKLIENHKQKFSALLTFAFNPSILALKVMNQIECAEIYVKSIEDLNLDHVVAWQKCKLDIERSGI